MSKLQTLCDMFNRVETEVKTRQDMLANLETQIMGLVENLTPKILREFGIELPDALSTGTSRQRIKGDTEMLVVNHMIAQAKQHVTFTRPELVNTVRDTYPISVNILNRLFDAQGFNQVGVSLTQGSPIVYSMSNREVAYE